MAKKQKYYDRYLGMCPLSPFHQNMSDFLGEKKVLYLTPLPQPQHLAEGLPSFLSAIFKPTRRKSGRSPDPTRLVSDSGTKAAP